MPNASILLRPAAALAVAALSASLVAGCQNRARADPLMSDAGMTQRLIADAASAQIPDGDGESSDVVAIVESGRLVLANLSDTSYRNVRVWVNGSFVRQISSLPARGQVPIALNTFYDASGARLSDFNVTVNNVALQSNDTLLNALGVVPIR